MFQMGGVGPMLGQAHHFLRFNPGKTPYAERALRARRRSGSTACMDRRLAAVAYLAGDELTIADFATWPWLSRWEWQGIDLRDFPNVRRWYVELARAARRCSAATTCRRSATGSRCRRERALTSASVRRVAATRWRRTGSRDRIVELAATARTAEDAARACGVPVGAIVKSLVFEIAGAPVLALVAGDRRCDLAALAGRPRPHRDRPAAATPTGSAPSPASRSAAWRRSATSRPCRPRSTPASAASSSFTPPPAIRTACSRPTWPSSARSPAARWPRSAPINSPPPRTIEATGVETWPSG